MGSNPTAPVILYEKRSNMIQIPFGATVVRFYDRGDSIDIDFGFGDPRDYIWSTWEKSNWKSIDYILGKVDNENNPIVRKKLI